MESTSTENGEPESPETTVPSESVGESTENQEPEEEEPKEEEPKEQEPEVQEREVQESEEQKPKPELLTEPAASSTSADDGDESTCAQEDEEKTNGKDVTEESVSDCATRMMNTNVVFTSRKLSDVSADPSIPTNGINSPCVSQSPVLSGIRKPLSTQASTDSMRKAAGGLSNLFSRLRGAPAPVSAGTASSTTGLIFENRPSNLPAKSTTEEKKHRKQYEAMLEAAEQKKKKEQGALQREATDRLKREEEESTRLSCWLNDILPHWESLHSTRKARDLWWCGLPTRVRGQVWRRALGNDLQVTQDLYEISKARAEEMLKLGVKTKTSESTSDVTDSETTGTGAYVVSDKSRESSVELIHLDVRRTFPQLGIFQDGGPLHEDLHDVLCAYSCYRPDMGYVQGMSFLAAVLILNMSPSDAFICLANLLCKPIHMALFRLDDTATNIYFNAFSVLLDEVLPKLSAHFKEHNVPPALFLVEWFFTSFSKSLPLDVASRVWDMFFRDGDEFLYRTGFGILHLYQPRMLAMDFSDLALFLTHLPDDINVDELFQSIGAVNLTAKRYQQVMLQQREKATASC